MPGKGDTVTARLAAEPVPQELPAATDTFPLVAPIVTVTELVPCPKVTEEPEGTVQVYEFAPGTAVTE